MRFQWDERKCALSIAKHVIDFADLEEVFDGRARFDMHSPRGGEARTVSVVLPRGRSIAVVWTLRDADLARIISARGARDAEKRQYRHLYG